MSEVVARLPHGVPCWVSLLVRDLSAAQDFYGDLFGWQFRPGSGRFGPYGRALLADRQVAGVGELPAGQALPVAWTPYFSTGSADLTTQRVRENGGTVAVGPLDAGSAGRMTIASDTSGAVFGVWEGRDLQGAEVMGEPGSLVWNELITHEPALAGKFYTAVFGGAAHEAAKGAGGRVVLSAGGRDVAGITGPAPRDRRPYWLTCFAVESSEAAARRVTDLGGRVLREPHDTAQGRQATVTDREGAAFAVIDAAR